MQQHNSKIAIFVTSFAPGDLRTIPESHMPLGKLQLQTLLHLNERLLAHNKFQRLIFDKG